ncbi:hypothetical protein SCLCIDRAFT_1222195 [Scleroderma citrinum Foug A]|uniref:Poly A polymerase head domain-containing protein n=1 Tax=Scleroderma citrinum Foug A TaxID=1036808 RepID=A0A0C2ZNP9_9AGAM|nr:hypothetical protein SCLCIDRAFT_1222195 [Scleroderma citrinum Foug A]
MLARVIGAVRTFSMSLAHTTTRMVPKVRQIELTHVEDQLCSLLDEFTRFLEREQGTKTACRINGGWVRDKLLGQDSNDVDICLADMMGVPFVEQFVAYLSERKHIPVNKVTKIESNPDQSKHLETARTTLLGVDLDFVNLRSEEYTDDSRIPTGVKFGTPLEDALRRDITINSLFYNVHTRAVEDHTEKGLDDLRDGVIRTPLPPLQTFRDDPLRVVRCVRFASRFGFEMAPELRDAAQDKSIQEALSCKISRERIGEELDKMIKGVQPVHAVQLINELSLFNCIFHVPANILTLSSSSLGSLDSSLTACTILRSILSSASLPNGTNVPVHPMLLSYTMRDPGTKARLFMAASLFPFYGITYKDRKQKEHYLVEAVIREGLKLGNKNYYLDGIPALFGAASELIEGLSLDQDRFKAPSERVSIGLFLRHPKMHKPTSGSNWSSSLLFSLVCELTRLRDIDDATKCIERYNAFTTRVDELGLGDTVEAKPLLNGNEVVGLVGGKPGPWTKIVLDKVLEWQLEHPLGDKAACTDWLKEEYNSQRINVQELVESTSGSKRVQAGEGGTSKKVKR